MKKNRGGSVQKASGGSSKQKIEDPCGAFCSTEYYQTCLQHRLALANHQLTNLECLNERQGAVNDYNLGGSSELVHCVFGEKSLNLLRHVGLAVGGRAKFLRTAEQNAHSVVRGKRQPLRLANFSNEVVTLHLNMDTDRLADMIDSMQEQQERVCMVFFVLRRSLLWYLRILLGQNSTECF
jgi:hypothetical protein